MLFRESKFQKISTYGSKVMNHVLFQEHIFFIWIAFINPKSICVCDMQHIIRLQILFLIQWSENLDFSIFFGKKSEINQYRVQKISSNETKIEFVWTKTAKKAKNNEKIPMVFAYERAQNFKNVVNFLRFFLENFLKDLG